MAKHSWPWAGHTVGDALDAPYTNKYFADMFQLLTVYDRTTMGVVDTGDARYAGGLQVAAGAGFVTIQTGVGISDGMWVTYDAPFNIPPDDTPSIRTDLVVIRKTVSAAPLQEVNVVIKKGTDGSAVPPALTQNLVTWEIPLAEVPITPGPTIGAIVNVAVAIRTPLGPGYQYDALVNDDSAHTANAWNSLDADAGGVKVTLGPGKWEVSGAIQFYPGAASSDVRGAQLYNVTLSAEVAQASAPPDSNFPGDPVTIAIPRTPVSLGVVTEIALRFYARNVGDVVYGSTVSGLRGLGTSIIATRIV